MKKRIFAIMLAVISLVTFFAVPIGAEENEEDIIIKSPYQSNFQSILETTPGCNLITMPYEFSQDAIYEYDDLTIITRHNGSLTLNGCADDDPDYYNYIELAHVTLKRGQYFLSGYFGEYASHLYVSSTNEEQYWICNEDGTLITINDATLNVEIGLCIEADEEFDNVNIQPMLTKGDTAYPYQPYLPYLFGYELGVSAGYSNGYAEGLQVGNSSTDINEVYNQGYEAGYNEAMQKVDPESYAKGYEEGKAYGVNIGIKQGEQSQVTENFIGIIGEIAMAPYTAITEMFSFKIFGINVAGLIFQLITTMVVLLVVGLLFKYIF